MHRSGVGTDPPCRRGQDRTHFCPAAGYPGDAGREYRYVDQARMAAHSSREVSMAKDKESGVYRIVDVVGVSTVSWEDAAKRAVETAAKSIRDLRIAEVTKMDMKVEGGKVLAFRTRVALSFKYEG
jgi:dodecin